MIWEIGANLTMIKADLIEEVSRVVEIPRREAEVVVETMPQSIVEVLRQGDKVQIRGFGRFDTRQRPGRMGRNPKPGQVIEVPPKRIPYFKPSKPAKRCESLRAPRYGAGG